MVLSLQFLRKGRVVWWSAAETRFGGPPPPNVAGKINALLQFRENAVEIWLTLHFRNGFGHVETLCASQQPVARHKPVYRDVFVNTPRNPVAVCDHGARLCNLLTWIVCVSHAHM